MTQFNNQNVIYSRDVIARIEELEAERADLTEAIETAEYELECANDTEDSGAIADAESVLALAREALQEFDDDDDANGELTALKEFASELEGYGDWQHGETLIADSYFPQYAEELARDLYDLPDHWPIDHIDWEAAAEALKIDYTSADLDGETFYMRA